MLCSSPAGGFNPSPLRCHQVHSHVHRSSYTGLTGGGRSELFITRMPELCIAWVLGATTSGACLPNCEIAQRHSKARLSHPDPTSASSFHLRLGKRSPLALCVVLCYLYLPLLPSRVDLDTPYSRHPSLLTYTQPNILRFLYTLSFQPIPKLLTKQPPTTWLHHSATP